MASAAMLFLTMMVICYYSANAQAPAGMPVQSPMAVTGVAPAAGPVGETDCTTALFGMSDCLGYVQQGSNATKPDPACCPELSGLLKNQPTCLCLLLGDTSSTFGIQIDLSRAIDLPKTCGLQLPDLSACPAAPSPSAGEAPASSGVPAYSPGGLTLGPGVAATPESANNGNGALTIGPFGLASFLAVAVSLSL
ncbi:hypothetical protein ACET3Z_024975 [Daucus carota]